MKLTEHFSLEELTASDIAQRNGLDNTPNDIIVGNLNRLARLLEEVRLLLNKPIRINSGYRAPAVNALLGSKSTSQHCLGCAADIKVDSMKPDEIVKAIVNSNIKYDQIIREFDSWVHISVPNSDKDTPRKSALIIDKTGTRPYA